MNENGIISIKNAEEKDINQILAFIKKIAEYEKLSHQVAADEKTLHKSLFEDKSAEIVFAWLGNEPVAYAVYFYNFSTFLGKKGFYLEDIFVLPEMRGKGIGKKLFLHLVKKANNEGCGRFEFAVLDWNKPAREFYEKLGAEPLTDWIIYRLSSEKIKKLS